MARTYKYHFIYHIRILVGSFKDYFYVGLHSTNNIDDGYCGSGTKVSRIIKGLRKKGYKNNEIYERTILTFATSRAEANELESIYVDKNILLNEFSLNDKTGGDAHIEYSDETIAKISKSRKGIYPSDETRAKLSKAAKGRKLSDEHRMKISNSKKGKKRSDETIAKMSKSRKGIYPSDETRAKLSKAHKGHQVSIETREKISNANKGKKRSYETRMKKSIAIKGRHWYNNGIYGAQYFDGTQPEGWVRGKIKGNTHWYTNGIDSKQYFEGEEPEGWVRGRLSKKNAA